MGHAETILIVGRPGQLRDALQAMLTATEAGRLMVETWDGEAPSTAPPVPASLVILLGGQFGEELPHALRQARVRWPEAGLLVLVGDAVQWRAAKAFGADRVYFEGMAPEKLVRLVGRLLERRG